VVYYDVRVQIDYDNMMNQRISTLPYTTLSTYVLHTESGDYVVKYSDGTLTIACVCGASYPLLRDTDGKPFVMRSLTFERVPAADADGLVIKWLETSGALLPYIKPVYRNSGELVTAWSTMITSASPLSFSEIISTYDSNWHQLESDFSSVSYLPASR